MPVGGQRVNTHCAFRVVNDMGRNCILDFSCVQGQAKCAWEHLGGSPDSRFCPGSR